MMVRAAFFDIDGTLVSHATKTVPTSTRQALATLRRSGVLTAVATGRHCIEIDRLPIADIPFDGFVTLNGQLCLDAHRTVYAATPIGPDDTRTLAEAFAEKALPILLVERDRMYANLIDANVTVANATIHAPLPELTSYEGAPLYQAMVYGDESARHKIVSRLTCCRATQWHESAIDIISRGGSKYQGVKALLARHEIAMSEAVAFGDGQNDVEMLRGVGLGVAMGNACEEAKEAADYVTSDIDDDGVSRALLALGICPADSPKAPQPKRASNSSDVLGCV